MRIKLFLVLTFVGLMLLGAQAHAQSHAVSLKWNASVDVASNYNVYRLSGACPASGTTGFTKITATAVTGTAYSDTAVAAGTYCYYVTSVLNGAESVPSNLAVAVILPAAPTSLSIAGTN